MSTILMLSDTTGNLDVDIIGDKVRADGYFGYQDGLHTISIQVSSFIGRVFIEASLAVDPTEKDWDAIHLGGLTDYLDFPLNPDFITAGNSETGVNGGDTGTSVYNFEGNFIWLRARVTRSHLGYADEDDTEELRKLGSVIKILLVR